MASEVKRVLITGASRGIGFALAKYYALNGWKVIAAVRNVDNVPQLQELQVEKIVALDVVDEESINAAAAQVGQGVPIHLLINNAGALVRHSLEDAKKSDLMHLYEVNAVGPWLVTRAFLPNLVLAASASTPLVVQISSVVGSIGLNEKIAGHPQNYGYRASKAALNSLSKSLSVDLGQHGICTLMVHPGYVQTELTDYRGHISVDESIQGMTAIISNATFANNGTFYSVDGSILPW